jgi:hypothetical protein
MIDNDFHKNHKNHTKITVQTRKNKTDEKNNY